MSKSEDPKDRFGMSQSAVRATIEAHIGVLRAGMYVPIREEVATSPTDRLYNTLMDWR